MRELIKKADGTPAKSRIFAVKFLEEKGIGKDKLIEENGQFYYETEEEIKDVAIATAEKISETTPKTTKTLSWETPVFDSNEINTNLKIKSADVGCKLKAKHPAGQNLRRPYNALEIEIDGETFIFSLKLAEKLFEVEV